jgi:predicted RNase H-like HicB family nuclease
VKFSVTIDRDEDGAWVVECPSIPGCVSQGATLDEALENIKDAVKLCLEVRDERGMPLQGQNLTTTANRLDLLRQARGMWKDRDDLPALE